MEQKLTTSISVDLNALDIILDAFSKSVSNPDTDRPALYRGINQQLVAGTEALASLIVAKNREGQIRILAQFGWDTLSDSTAHQVKQLINRLFSTDAPAGDHRLKHARAFVGRSRPRNGLELIYLLIRDPEDSALTNQVFSDLASEIATQLESFENLRNAERKPKSVEELAQIAQLIQNMGKSTGLLELAFNFVNDMAKITRADRVSLMNPTGKVLAISGVSNVSNRTSFSRSLSTISRLTQASNGSVEWADGELVADGNRVPRGLHAAVKQMAAPVGFAIPIKSKSNQAGVVVLEYLSDENRDQFVERRELINETINFASPVLTRAVNLNSIPAIGKLDFLFNRCLTQPVRAFGSVGLGAAILAGCIYGLFGIERPFEISVQGVLQVSESRHVFSPLEGEVERLSVQEGSDVTEDSVLVLLKSVEIEQETVEVEGELAESRQQLRNLILSENISDPNETEQNERTKIASEVERLKIRIETLELRQEFLQRKKERMTIVSPMAGRVTTPNLQQRLTARPLNRGDVIMTISNIAGPWELELLIPDNCVEFIQTAQQNNDNQPVPVKFRLASNSNQVYHGTLREIDFRAEPNPVNDLTYAKAFVDLDEQVLGDALRLGTRVYGKFECGEKSNFFLLTYEIRNKLREWLFF